MILFYCVGRPIAGIGVVHNANDLVLPDPVIYHTMQALNGSLMNVTLSVVLSPLQTGAPAAKICRSDAAHDLSAALQLRAIAMLVYVVC